MKNNLTQTRNRNGRGSALIVVMYMITIMSLVLGVHFYRNSQQAAIEGQVRENEAGAQAAAEYAAEMVIANLGNMEFKEEDGVRLSIEKDWVGSRPYGETGLASAERRIAGTVDGYDYRVVVRAVREAKKVEPVEEQPGPAWLAAINPDDYAFGEDSIESFTGAYEVIASARKTDSYRKGGNLFSPQFAYDSTVRTVVNMDYSSIVNLQNNLAVLSLTGPIKDDIEKGLGHSPGGAANLAPRTRDISMVSSGPGGGGGGDGDGDGDDDDDGDSGDAGDSAQNDDLNYPRIENVLVSGEDHYSHKAAVKDKNDDGTIATWDTIKANSSELFSVTNDYWDKGKMTLHYRFGDGWNPRIPRTVNFDSYMRTPPNIAGNTIVQSPLNQDTVYRYQYEDALLPATERRIVDQYIYGGKVGSYEYENLNPLTNSAIMYRRGRSVTLDADYRIIETAEAQADPDAIASDGRGMTTTTLAVSKYENIFNLYFTLVQTASVHSHPDVAATDHEVQTWIEKNWTYQSLGYFSKAQSKIMTPQITKAIRPLDNYYSPERRRWATLVWIKNGDAQFLVREYPDDANYENPLSSVANPTGTWYGTYRWAYYVGYNSTYKYHMGTWLDTIEGQGVSSGKNYSKNINTRFLTMEELLGCVVTKGEDGLPAAFEKDRNGDYVLDGSGKRILVGGVPDFELDEHGNRIPYDPDGTGTVFNEHYQRQDNNGDNFGITPSVFNDPTLSPPTDGIYVRLEDDYEVQDGDVIWQGGPKNYKYKRYQTIQDFYHVRNVADDDEEEDFRDITSLHMVLEITPEDPPTSASSTQEYGTLYFDMGLTLAVVYPKLKDVDDDEYFLEDIFRHWWQGESQESLTGEVSQKPVYAILEPVPEELEEDLEDFYYRQFGFVQPRDGETLEANMANNAPNIYSMLGADNQPIGMGLAKFIDEGEDIGVLDKNAWGQPGDEFLFHYGQDILYEFYSYDITEYYASKFIEWLGEDAYEQLTQRPDEYYARLDLWREELALDKMIERNKDLDAGIKFERLEKRFDGVNRFQRQMSRDKVLDLLRIPKVDITTRYFYSQLFGFRNVQTPVARAKLDDVDGELTVVLENDNPVESVETRAITFMACDFSPALDELEYVKPLYRPGSQQPNGWPLDPKIIWNHGTLEKLKGEGWTEEELAEKGYTEDLDTVYYYPPWFLDSNDFNDTNLKPPLKEAYPREHRGRIGWHREGPYDIVHVPQSTELTERQYRLTYGDHYEFTILAEQGFIPYETVMVTVMTEDSTTEVECVALFYTGEGEPSPDEDDSEDLWQPKLKAPAKMPTFVIKNDVEGTGTGDETLGELDGAGILVVNGNLRVRTRLAYHGTVVVLGDLIVGAEDEDDSVIARDKYGEAYDADGNQLEWREGTKVWGYYTNEETGVWVNSTPVRQFLGDIIIQGMLVVGGDVVCLNEQAWEKGNFERVEIPAGTIDLRGSKRAIAETTGTWSKAAPYEGLQMDRIGWTSGVNTSDMNLWKD